MTRYVIDANGWVRGELPGPDMPYEVEVIPSTNNPHTLLLKNPPDLCLHTTEGSHVNPALEYEPQWIVGEHRIVQLHPVRCKGYSVDTMDAYIMQIECVAMSTLKLGLFPPETQNPLVALVAMLHNEHLITTGTARPKTLEGLPLVLDKLPAAVDGYYRRFLAPEPQFDGVRGHVDMRDDEHWDPGSYDYPTFFSQVETLIAGGDNMSVLSDDEQYYSRGSMRFFNGYGPPAANAHPKMKEGYEETKAKVTAGAPGGVPQHKHAPGGVLPAPGG